MDTIYFNGAGTWATQTAAAWSEDRSFIEILNSFRFRTFRIGVNHRSLHSVTGYVNGGTLHNNHLHFEDFDFDSVITVRE